MEEKRQDERQELTNMISQLTIEYEDFLPETFPINYTTLNPLIKIRELQNKASDKSIDFKNTYHKVNSLINKMVSHKYQDFNDTLFVYQDLFKKYKAINEITVNIITEHEIIKKRLFINFKKLIREENELKERNLIKMIYKRIHEINDFILKFKKTANNTESSDKINEPLAIEISELEKNLVFYKMNIISHLEFIKEYNLDENDFVLEIKIELNRCKQFLIKYLNMKVSNYIFQNLSNPVILSIKILQEFGVEKDLRELIRNSFKKNLYLNLNKICKNNASGSLNPIGFNSMKIKSQKEDDPNTFENEILNYSLKVYSNLDSINMKESIFKEEILYELKRIFNLNNPSEEVFQISNIQDSLNYNSLFANTNISRSINNTSESKYGEYNIYKKDFNLNIKRLIKLNNTANIKYSMEGNTLLKDIIIYTEKQLTGALKGIDREIAFCINNLLLNMNSLKIDESNKRLNFYTQFISKMVAYKGCLNFLNYFQYFVLIIDLVKGKYNVKEINKVENIKDYFIEPSKIYSKENIRELIYSIYTVNDLKAFLLQSSFIKIEGLNSTASSDILIHMFNDLIDDLRSILKYKLLITIYYYFDRYLREGIDFIKTIRTLFYGFTKKETTLITDLRRFKRWECKLFISRELLMEYSRAPTDGGNTDTIDVNNASNNVAVEDNNKTTKTDIRDKGDSMTNRTLLRNEFYGVFIEAEKTKDAEKLFKKKFDKFYFSIIYAKVNELIKEKHTKISNKNMAIKNLMLLEELVCSLESGGYHSYEFGCYESSSFLLSYKLLSK